MFPTDRTIEDGIDNEKGRNAEDKTKKKTQIRNFFIFSTSKTWLLRMSETLYLNTSSK